MSSSLSAAVVAISSFVLCTISSSPSGGGVCGCAVWAGIVSDLLSVCTIRIAVGFPCVDFLVSTGPGLEASPKRMPPAGCVGLLYCCALLFSLSG